MKRKEGELLLDKIQTDRFIYSLDESDGIGRYTELQ
jgi:hypothetical protein